MAVGLEGRVVGGFGPRVARGLHFVGLVEVVVGSLGLEGELAGRVLVLFAGRRRPLVLLGGVLGLVGGLALELEGTSHVLSVLSGRQVGRLRLDLLRTVLGLVLRLALEFEFGGTVLGFGGPGSQILVVEVVRPVGILIIGDQVGGFVASGAGLVLFALVLLGRDGVGFVEVLGGGFGLEFESGWGTPVAAVRVFAVADLADALAVVLVGLVLVLGVLVVLAGRGRFHENKIINAINAITGYLFIYSFCLFV